jgi:hypothetical protein
MLRLVLALTVLSWSVVGATAATGLPEEGGEAAPALEAEAPKWDHYPAVSSVPPEYILANNTVELIFAHLALKDESKATKGTIIYNTFSLANPSDPSSIEMVNNFCFWLARAGKLRHTVLITDDEATWHATHERGHPVFLDRSFPPREVVAPNGDLQGSPNRQFDVSKHWWGSRLIDLNFNALYMDNDVVVLSPSVANALRPLDAGDEEFYDVQGLSDWGGLDLPERGDTDAYRTGCNLYFWVEEPRAPFGECTRHSLFLS